MIQFFYSTAPNPMKVALLLEELELPYNAIPVDTRMGAQHEPQFKLVNPNAKVPVLQDGDATVFDSNGILLYLAGREQKFVPSIAHAVKRADMLSWLMFIATGIGPFSGQSVHFRHVAPEPKEYALNRYDFEAHRHWAIIEERLATHTYMLGDEYSIIDMSFWGWSRLLPFVLGTGEDTWKQYPNVKRLTDLINQRPAIARVEALKTKHTFKTENDESARKFMFPQNERLKK